MSKLKIIKTLYKGHRSKIILVKRKSKLCIWKRSSRGHTGEQSLRRQLKRIKQWKKFGLSKVKAKWYKDGILKTYVKGKDLKKIIKKRHNFFSKKSKELKALKKFVKALIDSNRFIHDMKGLNIIFDGKNWNIIDSGPIYKKSRSSAKKEYKKILYVKWSKLLDSKKERKHLKSFLGSF